MKWMQGNMVPGLFNGDPRDQIYLLRIRHLNRDYYITCFYVHSCTHCAEELMFDWDDKDVDQINGEDFMKMGWWRYCPIDGEYRYLTDGVHIIGWADLQVDDFIEEEAA